MRRLFDTVQRRTRQLSADPALRRWLVRRLLRLEPAVPDFAPHQPPYLTSTSSSGFVGGPSLDLEEYSSRPPTAPLDLFLSGTPVQVDPESPGSLYSRSYDDTETLLAAHRFAWVPLADTVDPDWVSLLWQTWMRQYGTPDDSWAWHPYTAAERLINILSFAEGHGLPGPTVQTLDVLAAHGPAIFKRLEFFGDHDTGNHLSNNGRGLFVLGLKLSLSRWADIGAEILCHEAGRIFLPSGVLREGSSHYHLLLTRNYVQCWLLAEQHGHTAAPALKEIAQKALAVLPHLDFKAGLPLIGDVSPDCPPTYLNGLFPGAAINQGWTATLDDDARRELSATQQAVRPVRRDVLRQDGWTRFDNGDWSGLWFLSPTGWSPMPGHGHQDAGNFELHHRGRKIFVDPGRGAYGEDGDAALYRSGQLHNTLLVNNQDPYPPNKPYYTDAFRQRVCGAPPTLTTKEAGVVVRHSGYTRSVKDALVTRSWTFSPTGMVLTDHVDGRGTLDVTRRLYTTLDVNRDGDDLVLSTDGARYRLRAEGALQAQPVTLWQAYGTPAPGIAITRAARETLPYQGTLSLDIINA